MGWSIYDPDDMRAERRPLDDMRYALDHFRTKLLGLGQSFQTATGSRMAAERTRVITTLLAGFEAELQQGD